MEFEDKFLHINVDDIIPNKTQPRENFNEETIKELSESIKEYGMLNPILVRKKEDKYEIIAGERRYRAAKMAGIKEIPVIVKNVSDDKMTTLALIENLQKENIGPIEEAKSYQQIMQSSKIDEEKLGIMIGKTPVFINNKIKLLSLPEKIQQALTEKKISEKHARILMNVTDQDKQKELLDKVIKEKITVKELDNLVNEKKVTEKEIQEALNDIMKSLNIDDENKEEEKESDKMNNENFFPNYNNQQPNNEMSLNTMNMQTMNQYQTQSGNINQGIPEIHMPTQTPQMPQPAPVMAPPVIEEQPLFNPELTQPMPSSPEINNFEHSQQPMMQEMPLFNVESQVSPENNNLTQPVFDIPAQNQMPQPAPVMAPPVIEEQPLFNPELTQPIQVPETNMNETFYEVPVNISPVIEEQNASTDKFTQVKELLSNNGIEYKAYSNETGNCIIIEI